MKTFNDLEFKKHPIADSGIERYKNAKHAVMSFDNKYGVSVIFGSCFYSNGIDNYELAILYNNEITYNTKITNDVMGHLSEDKVSEIMIEVQKL